MSKHERIRIDDTVLDVIQKLPLDAETALLDKIDDVNRVLKAKYTKGMSQLPVLQRIASARDCHINTIRGWVATYESEGISALIDGRTKPAKKKETRVILEGHRSKEFAEFIAELYMEFDRRNGGRMVYEELLHRWRVWQKDPHGAKPIPGYTSPPPACPTVGYKHPRGWSERSIANLKPGKYDLDHARQGPQFAALGLASIHADGRKGLQVGQVYMFDDFWSDSFVMIGKNKPTRSLGLVGLDLFSGKVVALGLKPRQRDEEEGQKELNATDTMWFVVHLLTTVGYLESGTVLVCESGTMSIDERFEKRIEEATKFCVSIDRGEVSKEKVRGMKGLARGNPRHKPQVESLIGFMHNTMGFVPAPAGRKKEEQHEGTVSLLRREEKLFEKASKFLSESQIAEMVRRVLPWERFRKVALAAIDFINNTTEHQLSDWSDLGFETVEYRVGHDYCDEVQFHRLPLETQQLVEQRIETEPGTVRMRRLSRAEVFKTGENKLRRLDPFRWHLIIPVTEALARRVPDDAQLVIKNKKIDPNPIIFETYYYKEDGADVRMPAGKNVLVYLNPYDPSRALICTPEREMLGLLNRLPTGNRFDESLLERQYAARNKTKAEIGHLSKKFDEKKANELARDDAKNQAMFDGVSDDVLETEAELLEDPPEDTASLTDISPEITEPPIDLNDDEDDDEDGIF